MAYDSKKIREKIAELIQNAEALNALATDEKRELTEKETQDFNACLEQVGEKASEDSPATGLYAELEKAEKFERIKAELSQPANRVPAPVQDGAKPTIKAVQRVRRDLKAYKREEAEDAYRAGRWLHAALFNSQASRDWCADNGLRIQAAQTEGSNAKGGFLVPDEFSQAIIDLREQYGVSRQWARVVPMASDHMVIPRRKSGVTAYAVNENDSITASDKEWSRVELTAKKWAVLVRYSSELAEDAFINLADDLASEMAYAFAEKEDDSLWNGDGTSTYHGVNGILTKVSDGNHAVSEYVAASGNTAFSTLDLADFEGALGTLPQYAAARNPAWFISRVGYYESMSRLMNAGGGNNNDDLGAGPGMNFLGLPVVIVQKLNSTTTAQVDTNLFAVGDLSLAATIGDRRDFMVATSTERYFDSDELAIRGTTRTAINVHDLGDGTDAGPLVVVRTPSS